MDNKQNRKLYWEIKDFYFNKNDKEFKSPKKSSLLEDITNILKSQTNLTENDLMIMKEEFSKSASNLKNKTTDMLYSYQNILNKQKSSNIKNSSTITANPFNLKEQLAGSSMVGGSTLNVSKKNISLEPNVRVSTNINPDGTTEDSADQTAEQPEASQNNNITGINANLNLSQVKNQQQVLPGIKPQANNNLVSNQTAGPSMTSGNTNKKLGFENLDKLLSAANTLPTTTTPTRGEDSGLGKNASNNAILFGKSTRAYK